jgi:hypothetical protein
MQIHTYQEIFDGLNGFEKWLDQIGITFSNHRIRTAVSKVQELESIWRDEKRKLELIQKDGIGPYLWALTEVYEFRDIYKALMDYDDKESLKIKLTEALRGPADPVLETSDTNMGRNIMFELNLASFLYNRGLEISLKINPDILCEFEGVKILIQCKRPFVKNKISKNHTNAKKQLIRDLNESKDKSARGIIAISISRIINKGDMILTVNNKEEIYEALVKEMEKITGKYARHRKSFGDNRIIGVLYHYITPASIKAGLPFVAQFTELPSIASNKSDIRLMRNLASIFESYANI